MGSDAGSLAETLTRKHRSLRRAVTAHAAAP